MSLDKRDLVTVGSEVRVYYQDLPPGVIGVVRVVMDKEEGILSVRIPPYRVPAAIAATYGRDPRDPGYIPIVLTLDEWEPVSTSKHFLRRTE